MSLEHTLAVRGTLRNSQGSSWGGDLRKQKTGGSVWELMGPCSENRASWAGGTESPFSRKTVRPVASCGSKELLESGWQVPKVGPASVTVPH